MTAQWNAATEQRSTARQNLAEHRAKQANVGSVFLVNSGLLGKERAFKEELELAEAEVQQAKLAMMIEQAHSQPATVTAATPPPGPPQRLQTRMTRITSWIDVLISLWKAVAGALLLLASVAAAILKYL